MKPDLYHQQVDQFIHKKDSKKKGFFYQIHAFITPFAPKYASQKYLNDNKIKKPIDYTHEREWRVPNDFKIDYKKIEFVIVDTYEDLAKISKPLKDEIDEKNFIIMDNRQIEKLWPTHKISSARKIKTLMNS